MKRFLIPAALIAAFVLQGTTPATAEWWDVPTSSETTARIRAVFVPRLHTHRIAVREMRQQRREARQEAAAAAAAAEAATAATPTATAAPVPTSTYTGGVLSDEQVASYLRAAGFPESAIPTMLYYSHRESGNDPGAINASSGACGLFQLYPCYGGSAWLDPATNARLAYEKYAASGFAPWGG